MSVPLKPISIDFSVRQVDSKQKKFHSHVQKALQHFESVTEWADYIANLGRLLKALQSWSPQFSNVKFYIPYPYQVGRELSSSLSPSLPSGVHLKALEVYSYIFDKIGLESISRECNIWTPGIFRLMSYASISVKGPLIELYEQYLIQLSPQALRILIKPMLASLFTGIEDESSEFQGATFNLIDALKENLADDLLFWQAVFLIMISNKDRRAGGLVWITKQLPSLNAVPHKILEKVIESGSDRAKSISIGRDEVKQKREAALELLLPAARDLVHPEPGLLVRCLVSCLAEENEVLVKRGVLDILTQRIHLSSPFIQVLIPENDRKMLIMACCRTMLNREMSISRRVWNWLLGPASATQTSPREGSTTYFSENGLGALFSGLEEISNEPSGIADVYKICLSLMDRWEIACHVIPQVFIPLMRAAKRLNLPASVLKVASSFFDSVETNIIWGKLFDAIYQQRDSELLLYVLRNFNVATEDEVLVRHLPLIFLSLLASMSSKVSPGEYEILMSLLTLIPDRAYLPVEHSQLDENDDLDKEGVLKSISNYYKASSDMTLSTTEDSTGALSPPFSTEDMTFLTIHLIQRLLIEQIDGNCHVGQIANVFCLLITKIPQSEDESLPSDKRKDQWVYSKLQAAILNHISVMHSAVSVGVFGLIKLYVCYLSSKLSTLESIKLSKSLTTALWDYLIDPNSQMEAMDSLKLLKRSAGGDYIERALVYCFLQENNMRSKVVALDAMWTHLENEVSLLRRPLEILLDELRDEQNSNYLIVSRWVSSTIPSGSVNRLFQLLLENLLACSFIRKMEISSLDDIEAFVYSIQMLTNVLKIDQKTMVRSLSTELTSVHSLDIWGDEDISTYKNLSIALSLRFLKIENEDDSSIRSTVIFLDTVIDGSEENFKSIVSFLLQLSNKFIISESSKYESISVSLLDIISKVLSLSHLKGRKLDIFEDDDSHLTYIDFLVTGVTTMRQPLVIESYVKLLSETLHYFQETLFSIALPLTTSMVNCIKHLFAVHETKGDSYSCILHLMKGLEEVLTALHGYLTAEEKSSQTSNALGRTDFLQSVVANVFASESNSVESRYSYEREIMIQSFRIAAECSLKMWYWARGESSISKHNEAVDDGQDRFQDSLKYHAFKFKFRTKRLLSALFALEPLEVLEQLISGNNNRYTLTLIHVLDENRPILTLPHLFQSIIFRCDKASAVTFSNSWSMKNVSNPTASNDLSEQSILRFVIDYTKSLENAAVEDYFGDFMILFREIALNSSNYKHLSALIFELITVTGEKIHFSKFGEQKKIKKELSETFSKYLGSTLAAEVDPRDSRLYENLDLLCQKLHYIVDEPSGDKFHSVLSVITQSAISPALKKKTEFSPPSYVAKLAMTIAKIGAKNKLWKSLLLEFFYNDKQFSALLHNALLFPVFQEWSQYPDIKDKLLPELITSVGSKHNSLGPAMIPFNGWSDTEITLKKQNLKRISFLLMISSKDTYLLQLRSLLSQIEQNFLIDDSRVKALWCLLLRSVLLRFSATHFSNSWSSLVFYLQTSLQQFQESLQIQQGAEDPTILHVCKCLDLLLTLNLEEFTAAYEWLFIIDTMNCIYKNDPYMSLVDEISDCKEFLTKGNIQDIELADNSLSRVPLLFGVQKITSFIQLRPFFHRLSYVHYEQVYGLKDVDVSACDNDLFGDLAVVD
ncbi:LAMI_0H16688g1_1 [Lachancea mirantina]|uniref:LAMI_0H16688g1_1 n=1 Tax=Lachancea mirantina TaxID=1230905 RepID=A0A1G4KJA4_9SACH|nr:LAMI_0H16688g1_1 [Lachancea mirantina]